MAVKKGKLVYIYFQRPHPEFVLLLAENHAFTRLNQVK